jgi:hypothetical protein
MPSLACFFGVKLTGAAWRTAMHQIIYLVGLIVVIMFILSLLGLR